MELASGTMIGGRYRLERLLGEGGMGAVWAARDTATGRRCALKLMKDAAADLEARKRFLREGRAASAVRHPNVVEILDVIEPEGEPPAIVMELLEGESLRAMLGREEKLSVTELAEIMVPVASAVGAAHALGIVHRDLKPENIFLARGPASELVVKVLDFGIAKLTALDGDAMRSTGITTHTVLGTPAYMAPEQVFAEKDLDHRADIWSLGIIFYKCLSGVGPTEGDNLGQVLKRVVAGAFEPLSQRVPDLPESISRLVARMLERERSQRAADLHEVLEVLASFASTPGVPFDAPAPHPRIAGDSRAGASPAPRDGELAREIDPLAKTLRGSAPGRRTRRSRAVLGIAAVIALLGVIAARSCWLRSPSSPLADAPPSSSGAPPGAGAGSCPEGMVRVPAGSFQMGSPEGRGGADEHPRHEVKLSAYCIDRTEVTVAAYEACVAAGACLAAPRTVKWSGYSAEDVERYSRWCNRGNRPKHPLNCVDWDQATAYCSWAGKRLPTEAEWEYAARGNTGREFPWGDEAPSAKRLNACGRECVAMARRELGVEWTAIYDDDDGWETTAPVGSYPDGASPFGVLDLAGNVWEWMADWYGPYSSSPGGAKIGTSRVTRGGGWYSEDAGWVRSAGRLWVEPIYRRFSLGFRCARGD
jgi:eukaryotic-like serine/threonine-protein kinase